MTTTCRSRNFRAMILATFFFLSVQTITRAKDADVQLFPASGDSSVCPDTPLRITFASAVTLGASGKITVFDAVKNTPVETIDIISPTTLQSIGGLSNYKYYPVIITGNEADIHLANNALSYNTAYYVTIDPGVFKQGHTDFDGFSKPTDWRFTTRGAAPAAGVTKITIAADGTGDFCTVQGAVDFIPDGNTTPTTLFIRKGNYPELIYFANKHSLTFLGEDRKQTVISYANNNKFNSATGGYRRGVFRAKDCDYLVIENLTIRNTTPRGGSQAEAIILNGTDTAEAILTDVDLYSFQDTLQINGQAYLNDCYIEGDVDFMWGTGPCFFENCHCFGTRSKAYYTQIRNTAKNHGYVYDHCTFDGPAGVTGMYLSRIAPSVFPASEVVLIDCALGDSVGNVAWLLNAVKGAKPDQVGKDSANVHFWEYNSHHADGKPVDTTQRLGISRQLTQPQDAATISDYSNPVFVLGNDWDPRKSAVIVNAPHDSQSPAAPRISPPAP